MISKQFYLQLIGRVLLLTTSALLLAFCWLSKNAYLVLPIGAIIIVQVISFIAYFNQTNRKIAYLFESIKNEDFSLQFPEHIGLKSFKGLNQSLNQFNQQIRENKIRLEVQEKYYQEILETASIGIFTINSNGHILFANPTVRKVLNLEQLTHIRQLERTASTLFVKLKKLAPFEKQVFQITNEREQFKFLVSATQIVLNKESILLVVIQNIKQELDQKETESWSKLIRVMTHEIMNTVAPITSVSASLLNHYFSEKGELLHPDLKVEHSHKIFEGLEIIKEQSQGLTSFVQSYRSLLNIPKPQKVIINVPELLAKVRLMMEKDLQSQQIELLIMNTHPDFEVFADEQQLTQVLVNLIKNAIQAQKGSKNGWIKMDCGKHSEGQKFIKISDNGPGIPTENIEQIFIPFFTTKVNGTGTGLSLVKQIMSLHGGRVEVSSFNNTGVEFVLFF